MKYLRLILILVFAAALAGNVDAATSELTNRILQRKDKADRQRALDEALEGLKSNDAAKQTAALTALGETIDVPYDRKPFVARVRELLKSDNAAIRGKAVWQLPILSKDPEDLPRIAEMAKDSEIPVREGIAAGLLALDPQSEKEITRTVIERLLEDDADRVLISTVRALWGHTVSKQAEERLVELSRREGKPAYDINYYALSTRPLVSRIVAERLIELLPHKDWNVSGRAAWGLGYHKISDEAKDIVRKALINELDENLQPYVRQNCIHGLGEIGGPEAVAKLKEIAASGESEKEKQFAEEALKLTEKAPAASKKD